MPPTGLPFAPDPSMGDELVLVDVCDRPLGAASKLLCHTEGLLHRAFSVVLVREGEGGTEVLLQRRAAGKYHSGGLWTNACCSHPRVGEDLADAVARRLREELGVTAANVREAGSLVYRATFAGGISEYEFDHVFVGTYDGALEPDASEASEVRWVGTEDLVRWLTATPKDFTVWMPGVTAIALRALRV